VEETKLMQTRSQRGRALAAAMIAAMILSTPASLVRAVEGLDVTTPYPAVRVDPGGEISFPLTITTTEPERVSLEVVDAPAGFETTIRGGGLIVDAVFTGGEEPPELELEVKVPEDAAPADYELVFRAEGSAGTTDLPLSLVVAEVAAGSVTLETEIPSVRGDSSQTFSFDLTLSNDTAQEITFGLEAAGEPGWDVTPTFSGEEQAATSVIAAGETATVNVEAVAPEGIPAGTYPLLVRATGGSQVAEAPLQVEITGSYAMSLTTQDERVSTTVTSGGSTTLPIVVTNDGTADLTDISLTASPPRDWEVTFEPATIPLLAIGQDATVTANIRTAGDSVAGDYQLTIDAESVDASDSIDVRTTVETSSIWGFVGIALIALVVIGLLLVFRRYGRR